MQPRLLDRLTEPEFPPLRALRLDCEYPAEAFARNAVYYRAGNSTPAYWLGKALLLASARWREGGLTCAEGRDVRRAVWEMEEFAPARLPIWLDSGLIKRGFSALRGLVQLWARANRDETAEDRATAIPPAVEAAAAAWEEDAFRFAAGCFAVDRENQGARAIKARAQRSPATRSPTMRAAHVLPEMPSQERHSG